MFLIIFLLLCAAVFPLQLFLCFRCRKQWLRCLPVLAILLLMVCSAVTASCTGFFPGQEEWQLPAVILFFIGGLVLCSDGLAWLIYGIVKAAQKHKNKFGM